MPRPDTSTTSLSRRLQNPLFHARRQPRHQGGHPGLEWLENFDLEAKQRLACCPASYCYPACIDARLVVWASQRSCPLIMTLAPLCHMHTAAGLHEPAARQLYKSIQHPLMHPDVQIQLLPQNYPPLQQVLLQDLLLQLLSCRHSTHRRSPRVVLSVQPRRPFEARKASSSPPSSTATPPAATNSTGSMMRLRDNR